MATRSHKARRGVLRALLATLVLLAVAPAAHAGTVTVRDGDTLSGIALRAGTTPEELARLNGITHPDSIRAGRRLRTPGARGAVPPPGPEALGTYRVRAGDTLTSIAARLGVGAAALARANGIDDPDLVPVGRILRRPGSGVSIAAASPGALGGTYRVRAGDTLEAIARRLGVTRQALRRANAIRNPNLVREGALLRVPGRAQAGPAATYTVRGGDTLALIAGRAGTTPGALARLNGISDPNMVPSGRVLRLPRTAVPPAGVPPAPTGDVRAMLDGAAARHGVDRALVRAVAWQESGFVQSARSSAGAVGVMQVMPATALWAGPALLGRFADPAEVGDNIDLGVAYLAHLLRDFESTRAALAAYNQGPGSLRRDGMYSEARRYVASVLALVGRV